jgi:hypothetical protein
MSATARPTDGEVLAALRTLAAWLGLSGPGAPETFDQNNLPPGVVSRGAFLERHRERVGQGVDGWTRTGKTRVVTREAWEAEVAAETGRPRTRKARLEIVRDPGDELDRALGVRVTRRAPR